MNYLSIQSTCMHEIEIKKSRFICHLFPIKSIEEVNEHLAQLRKKHYKAAHCCYAYILNDNGSIQKMSDDGEPSGTAGIPMLEVLKQHDLTYILAVVVRYFGGIKLGTGGLVRAYSQSVNHTIEHASLIQNISQMMGELILAYSQIDRFNYFIAQTDLPVTILDTHYNEDVSYRFAIHLEYCENFQAALVELFNAQFRLEFVKEAVIDIPYHSTK